MSESEAVAQARQIGRLETGLANCMDLVKVLQQSFREVVQAMNAERDAIYERMDRERAENERRFAVLEKRNSDDAAEDKGRAQGVKRATIIGGLLLMLVGAEKVGSGLLAELVKWWK